MVLWNNNTFTSMVQITNYECRWYEKWFNGFKLIVSLYVVLLQYVCGLSLIWKMAFCFYHVRSRHTDATWGVMEAVSSCPPHPLLSQQLCSQPLLYTIPSINLVSAPCLDLLLGSFILNHSHCPSSECEPSQSGLWVTSLISSFLTPAVLLSDVIMLTYSHMQTACVLAVFMHDSKGPAITVSCSYGNAYDGGLPYVVCEHVHLYIC